LAPQKLKSALGAIVVASLGGACGRIAVTSESPLDAGVVPDAPPESETDTDGAAADGSPEADAAAADVVVDAPVNYSLERVWGSTLRHSCAMRFYFACAIGLLACNGKVGITDGTNSVDASTDSADATTTPDAGTTTVDAASALDADATSPVQMHPRFVAVDATRVYWTEASGAGGVGWASKDGSSSGTFALPNCGTIAGIAVSTFINVAKDGSDPRTGPPGFSAAADGTGKSYLGYEIGVFLEDTIGVGLLISSSTTHAYTLAADPMHVFWSEFVPQNSSDPCATSAAGIVMRDPNTGGQMQLESARVPAFGLATNGGVLVWTDACAHTVNKLALGGTTSVLAPSLDGAIAVDSTFAYVLADAMQAGVRTLSSISLATGVVKSIIDIPGGGANVALDDATIYVAGANTVVRIPKPN
jgi:hypothetical protein